MKLLKWFRKKIDYATPNQVMVVMCGIPLLILFLMLLCSSKPAEQSCKETVEVLRQTIQVKEISNRTLREMVRKRDSIIYHQDSLIVVLENDIR